jgi:DNA polymerase III subunit alpha
MLLNCHSYFSFCYGTLSPSQLIETSRQLGYAQLVLSDINCTSAIIPFAMEAHSIGIKPIAGIDFRNGNEQKYIGIAINNKGFEELNKHLSEHLHTASSFDDIAPPFTNSFVVYPLKSYKGWTLHNNEFIGVKASELHERTFISGKYKLDKMVVLQTISFQNKLHFNAHRLLRAIDKNTLLSKLPTHEQAATEETFPQKLKLYEAFAPYPQIISNTEHILDSCHIAFEYGKLSNKNLKHFTDSFENDIKLIRDECKKGIAYRYGKANNIVFERLEKELKVIEELKFASYYLINWDIIKYAQHKNYYYVGRGSGSNSLVAYLLRITDVDPIELDLYFERFINIYRSNAPDFDMDFSWTDRDDIIQYIFSKYGTLRTAMLGAYSTFQKDATIRELGKVFGLPANEIDKLQNPNTWNDADEIGKLVLKYSKVIHDFPSHITVHSSGIIISENPIYCYSATSLPPKNFPVTHFSMLEAEDIGLYKFDILSQRGLGKIKDCIESIPDTIDIHDSKKIMNDESVKQMLRNGNTIGCFYVESPAMRMLLTKLKADDYLRLVAASSIIRPGVAKSGMMREYILRFRNENLRKKAQQKLPELYQILHETYGVMVYQEDVIKVAHLFAGLSLAEADYLRRGMNWKFKQRDEFKKVRDNFFENCIQKKYDINLITEIWNQIESFANFAFSKGHSASYAVESYQALYLKAHYPLHYLVATLNNGGGFYSTELYLHEARMLGGNILPPCINNSNEGCVLIESTIYLGLQFINEIETAFVQQIITERKKNGLFLSLHDFVKRVSTSIEQIRLLINAGTFAFTTENKKEQLWQVHALINGSSKKTPSQELFEITPQKWQLPTLTQSIVDEAVNEKQLFGFTLISPFQLIDEPLHINTKAKDLRLHINKTIQIIGYLVNVKRTATSKGDAMYFGTFIDQEGKWIDTVHFPQVAKQYPLFGSGCYLIEGKVVEEFDFVSIEVAHLKKLKTLQLD